MDRNDLSVKMLSGELEETKIDTRITMYGHRHMSDLPKILREVSIKCKPCEFRFNHLAIKYTIKDDYGVHCLRWEVYDGIKGNTKEFYNRDYVSDNGQVLWRKLAMDMWKK